MGKTILTTIRSALSGVLLPAWLLLPCALLLPTLALAAGLGRLTVLSALGQPLRAEIELVSVQPGESDSLKATLASQQAFRQANIDLNSALFDVRFEVERRAEGQFVVKLSSARPMNEPFIDMLVELNWSGGRLTREYTFLLDPPEYKAPAVAQPVTPPAVQAVPVPRPAPAPAAAAPAPQPAPSAAPPAAATYAVKRGDTLGKIAKEVAPPGVSLQQMLAALYRANQDAFVGNNMNRLRAGRILNVPDREAALSISAEDARRLVNTQGAEFADFQRSVGASVAAAPARPAEATRQSAGRITQGGATKGPAPAQDAARDQLRLSKPEDAKAGGRAAAAASADDQSARDKALKESMDRVAALEKSVQDLQKLLALKSAPGAQAQQQAEASKAAPAAKAPPEPAKAAPPEPAKAAPAPAPKAAEVPKAPEAPKAAEPTKGAEPSKAAPEPGKAPAVEAGKAPAADAGKAPTEEAGKAPDVAKAAPKAAPKAAAKAAPPPVEKGVLDELIENEYAIGGGLLVLLLLIGYAFYAWRRKKQSAEQRFGPSVMGAASSGGPKSSMLGSAGGQSIDTGSGPSPMNFSPGSPTPSADTEEIDPIAEADVYMAYGRDAQAEEILKEALAKNPGRTEVRMKLLEVYASRKDAKGFEATARELHTSTGGQGADWAKAAAMGLLIDPANALYGGTGESSMQDTQVMTAPVLDAEPVVPPPLDFDIDGETTQGAGTQPDIDLDAGPAAEPPAAEATATSIDFDLDLGGDKPAAEAPRPEDQTIVMQVAPDAGAGLDFDLGLGGDKPAEPEASAQAQADPHETQSPADANMIEFDLNLGGDAPAEPAAQAAAEPEVDIKVPELDLSTISLDLGADTASPGTPMDAKWQEVATKLDLAKAYEEMGDKDGARDLLNEVVKEGDAAQQEQAKTMLGALE